MDGPGVPMVGGVQSPAHGQDVIQEEQIDLTTFSQWIELQPVSTHIGLLELIANDLYRRRNYPTLAGEIKRSATDLRAMVRRHEVKV